MGITPKKILAIDDELEILIAVRESLEAEGYDVRTANNGVKGLEIAAEFQPDMIFLDVKMPQMDGFQFLQRMDADPALSRIPVCMVTGHGDIDNIFKAQASRRVRDFVIKPFQAIDLIDLMNRHAY